MVEPRRRPKAGPGNRAARRLTLTLSAMLLLGCASSDPDVEAQTTRGEDLYGTHCIECHGGATGGSITDVPPPHNAQGHTWHHGDCELVDMVLDGMLPRPGQPTMPAFSDELDEADVDAILAYIKTWWEDEQREQQERVTEQVCD